MKTRNIKDINDVKDGRYMVESITVDPDDEWQMNSERTVDLGVLDVKLLPEFFGIDLLEYPDTYFTSVAVIDPYKKEILRIANFVGGTEEFDGMEKTISISDKELRKSLFTALKQNSADDLKDKLDEICQETIEYFSEEDEDLMNL